jgi:hypothetical protein
MIEEVKLEQQDGTKGGIEAPHTPKRSTSTTIDWYSAGQSRTVECHGVRMTVRFVGRKGRRGRIKIEAPAGAVFRAGRE